MSAVPRRAVVWAVESGIARANVPEYARQSLRDVARDAAAVARRVYNFDGVACPASAAGWGPRTTFVAGQTWPEWVREFANAFDEYLDRWQHGRGDYGSGYVLEIDDA